ncbi:hypothetical protein [Streptomyces sp. NRRL F-4474]|uniref:hypothetical protein n=1 Tax=Streptomyces sp. NRRL F-4474 TaxID=1463851 RepID=UPI00131EAD0A|nr:hypothetical protein [Streptomyces sp. NRRL F-4474]
MSWWNRKPQEERARWVLEPLLGVGPLRFGMDPEQVQAALGGADASVSQTSGGRLSWQLYPDVGVTAIYGHGPRLVAVAVDPWCGPLVRLGDVELIARVPSEVRADIRGLARSAGVSVRSNWSGDAEVAAWGLSMGAAQDWGPPSEEATRKDRVITDALLVGSELAEDPYATAPVTNWYDVREARPNPGASPLLPQERPYWAWTPSAGVGPLRFGMTVNQVSAALGREAPAVRRGWNLWAGRGAGTWDLREEQFDGAGVTAHYWSPEGAPTLAAVTVDGRTGPQVKWDGIKLIGRPVSKVDTEVIRHIEERGLEWVVHCDGGPGPDELNMYIRATRTGDNLVSGARFFAPDWEDRG